MTLPHLFREAKRLGYFVENLAELPSYSWLYVPRSLAKVTLDTLCLPTATASREMSEDEYCEFEKNAEGAGLKCFLNRGQLEDIIENLKQQTETYSTNQLLAAIDYYWKHDAFIELQKAKAQLRVRGRRGEAARRFLR